MKQRPYFITSSGTGIGKTLLTSGLCWQLRQAGRNVKALKPVISGFSVDDSQSDTVLIAKSLGLKLTEETMNTLSPWRFSAPLSPHMAAAKEGIRLNAAAIAQYCNQGLHEGEMLLVEGAGGVMAPLNMVETMLDVMRILQWPVLLVVGNYLGSISHSLTALQVLQHSGLQVAAVVVNESGTPSPSLIETAQTLREFTQGKIVVTTIPRLSGQEQLYQHLPPLTHLLEQGHE